MKNMILKSITSVEGAEIVAEAIVLHKGWEGDNYAWLVRDDDGLCIVTTSHGIITEMWEDDLFAKIKETSESLKQLQNFAGLLGKEKRDRK